MFRNGTLRMLLMEAYRLKPHQLTGGPSWMNSDRYDIEAKADGALNFGQAWEMVKPLLADRFQVKFHRETREMPVYLLTVAKNGPKMRPSDPATQGASETEKGFSRET